MSDQSTIARWIVRPRPQPCPRARVFCFPHAGGGPSAYFPWTRALEGFEIGTVHLPGREARLSEAPLESLLPVRDAVTEALGALSDRPFFLFGHSLGSVLAFETARELRRRGLPAPRAIFASGRRAPHLPADETPLHPLPDEAFVAELCRRYGGIPTVILDEPELLALLLPMLRADIRMLETYRYSDEPPLGCPLIALGGENDPHARPERLRSWRELTTGLFRQHHFPGGHFFLHDDKATFLAWLERELHVLLHEGQAV